jgi:hypothetical protein
VSGRQGIEWPPINLISPETGQIRHPDCGGGKIGPRLNGGHDGHFPKQ